MILSYFHLENVLAYNFRVLSVESHIARVLLKAIHFLQKKPSYDGF